VLQKGRQATVRSGALRNQDQWGWEGVQVFTKALDGIQGHLGGVLSRVEDDTSTVLTDSDIRGRGVST